MLRNFPYQPFVAVSGNLGEKVPVVGDVLSSHEQEIYRTTSLDENCIESEFLTDRNCYVDLRQTYFYKRFSLIMSRNFPYQPFVAFSRNLGEKVPVVGDVLSSHEQEVYRTTSLDENCIESEFLADRNCYVDLRQTYLFLKLKLVKGRGYETYNTKEVKTEHKEEAKAEEEETAEEDPVPLVTHVNNILHSIFCNVEVYINN